MSHLLHSVQPKAPRDSVEVTSLAMQQSVQQYTALLDAAALRSKPENEATRINPPGALLIITPLQIETALGGVFVDQAPANPIAVASV